MTIDQTLEEFFKVKDLQKEMKKKQDELQAEINSYCDQHIDEFEDGVLTLEEAEVRIYNNPPKLVHIGSGKDVNVNDRAMLVTLLPEKYIEQKPNLTLMIGNLNGDKKLKQTLKSVGYEIAQETRFQAKAL